MQTEVKSLDNFYDEMLAAGMEYDQSQIDKTTKIVDEILSTPVEDNTDWSSIDEFLAEVDRIMGRPTKHLYDDLKEALKHKSYKDLTQEEKEKYCTHQSGILLLSIRPGVPDWHPIFCHNCDECFKVKGQEHKEKFEQAEKKAKKDCPDGQWRKVKVSDKKQSDALKKKLQRKENSRYMQRESTDKPGEDEIWIWTEDESYGEPANPESIDWEASAKQNKKRKREVSYGKGCRPSSPPASRAETEKVLIPQVGVDQTKKKEIEKILLETMPLKYAETHVEVQNLMLDWTLDFVKALKEANITVYVINDQYLQLVPEDMINEWNDCVNVARIRRKDY
jgi:hypothetical protein